MAGGYKQVRKRGKGNTLYYFRNLLRMSCVSVELQFIDHNTLIVRSFP